MSSLRLTLPDSLEECQRRLQSLDAQQGQHLTWGKKHGKTLPFHLTKRAYYARGGDVNRYLDGHLSLREGQTHITATLKPTRIWQGMALIWLVLTLIPLAFELWLVALLAGLVLGLAAGFSWWALHITGQRLLQAVQNALQAPN